MPNLFKDILSENVCAPNQGCGMARLIDGMAESDKADLEQALADPTITASAIDRALRKNGFVVSGNMVRRHRRKDCACGQAQ